METALRAGVSWGEFWGLTPYAVSKTVEAWKANLKHERRLQLSSAYLAGSLAMSDPKQRPTLEEILGDEVDVDPEQSPKEISASILRWAIRNGLEPDPA